MEETTAVVADSAPAAETAPSEAVEQPEVTQSDTTEPTTTESDPQTEPSDPDEDGEEPDSPDLTEEEKKTKSAERRERRQKREQDRIDKAVAERLETAKREQETAAEQQRQSDAARKAAEARTQRFVEYLGEPDRPDKPGTVTTLQQEWADANRQLREAISSYQQTYSQDDENRVTELTAKAAKAETRLSELHHNNTLVGLAEDYIWSQINEGGFGRVAEIPEMAASPEAVKRYMGQRDVLAGLQVLADTVRQSERAKAQAEAQALTEKHTTEMKAITADRNQWRLKAGGGEETPQNGGTPASGGRVYTREGLHRMLSTPEGMAEYRKNRAEIERQELAGLIR